MIRARLVRAHQRFSLAPPDGYTICYHYGLDDQPTGLPAVRCFISNSKAVWSVLYSENHVVRARFTSGSELGGLFARASKVPTTRYELDLAQRTTT